MKIIIKPKSKGQKKIKFSKGGLHRSLNVPENDKIPPAKRAEALLGDYGKKAKAQALFAKNVLHH